MSVTPSHDSGGGRKLPIQGPLDLGFRPEPGDPDTTVWTAALAGRSFAFRLLRSRSELAPLEQLQREVWGVSDIDLVAASALIVNSETGGDIIGAFEVVADEERLAAMSTAYGGFVDGKPRLCSDMLAVRPDYRSLGLGTALKRLQAGIALERGFEDITWTVDPLRAANARLNFAKLGAYSDRYERDRYGSSYGAGLYGGMPSDRLHITWPVRSPRVQSRLLGIQTNARNAARKLDPPAVRVPIPQDIDTLVAGDPSRALDWRMRSRELLEDSLSRGYVVAGFAGASAGDGGSALVLMRDLAKLLEDRYEDAE